MRRTRWTSALAWFAVVSVTTWVVGETVMRHRGWVPGLTPWGAVAALAISAVVLTCGLAVRRLRARRRTWITLTGAATTAAAAQASAIVGAAVGGAYAGQLALAVLAPPSPAMAHLAWSAAASLVACGLWCLIGFLVEHWCAISEDDDETPGEGAEGGAPA
ncbi:DUF3180 family protein [Actinomyces bowdenii]|uniref:DUF3180 family protein n=1 Tax=Actinomyces bowdenii TaxID=131109 RepID=A0A3P1VAZ9_9ACTO|nr:DUF3180 family protein [Actinomyces bowdenii]MBO3723694.1 DUF3180 family protein [Actinomyces bowdenii]RRD30837.1 DUF3180 family protein [Actinomyces bowdenii]